MQRILAIVKKGKKKKVLLLIDNFFGHQLAIQLIKERLVS
jgi:hypothetical protein